MGLLDKLLSRKESGQSPSTQLANIKQETSLRDQSAIEKAIAEKQASVDLSQCTKIPFNQVAALG